MGGHPDDQAYASWRGQVLAFGTNAHVDSTHPITAQGFVTNFASLSLLLTSINPVGVAIAVSFFNDSTLAQVLGGFSYQALQGSELRVVIPALGNFATIAITTTDATGGNITYCVEPNNEPCASPRFQSTASVVSARNVNVPHGTSIIVPMQQTTGGNGFWMVFDPNNTGKLTGRLVTLTAAGAESTTIDQVSPISPIYRQQFTAPQQPIGIAVQNTDTVDHTVTYYLAVDGR